MTDLEDPTQSPQRPSQPQLWGRWVSACPLDHRCPVDKDGGFTQVLAHCQVPVTDDRVSLSPGASHCTCRGLNRVFQKSDGSCICQAGHESSDERGLQSDESDGAEDCQPQVMPCSLKERKI